MALPYVFPSVETIASASSKLIGKLPDIGVGDDAIQKHLEDDILPALSSSSRSSNYYGFVTGGSTKAASLADNYVTEYDQNVQVHLPRETIATELEDAALRMICDLVGLPEGIWEHRTFTTGATASNVLGLACGREFVLRRHGFNKKTVAEHGLVEAMQAINIRAIQILTTVPHSSLRKAASIVGLGHLSVKDVGRSDAPHRFDLGALTSALSIEGVASIVVVSCAEVNTGAFATSGEDMFAIRKLCSTHTAWLHVDAAFGLQASVLPENDSAYAIIAKGVSGLWMADSITGDAHKLLNVVRTYQCRELFLARY
jgi:glutamate/tyrosine decarboxylase-like PLP-dependent enzyme